MITIVCVYNNKKIFSDYLLKSLQIQSAQFDLIALDNGTGAFSSAAEALNHGARSIHADSAYIMFAHQDISFSSTSWLADVELMLNALPNLGVAGVAGNSAEEKKLISNIRHGRPPRNAGRKIEKPTSVMTVDECCAIIPRQVFEQHQLDEIVCDNWHLYVVEYCLRIQAFGLGVFVLPVILHHESKGSLNASYFKALKKVLARYTKHLSKNIYIMRMLGYRDSRRSAVDSICSKKIFLLLYPLAYRLGPCAEMDAAKEKKKATKTLPASLTSISSAPHDSTAFGRHHYT